MLREVLAGVVLGTFTGLTPGIHVNTVGELGISDPVVLFSMGLVHTFLDVIPSTFLGIPDEGTALSVLPAHRLALNGRAMEVVRISLWASALAVLLSILLAPLYLHLARLYTPGAGKVLVLLLLLFMVLTAGRKAPATLLVLALSGILGLVVFALPLTHPYYLLFTGLFGVPAVAVGLKGKPPEGEDASLQMEHSSFLKFSFLGTLVGMLASLVPAFTPSQGAVLASLLSRDERAFLTAVFSINTANFTFSFMNYLATGRVRNGIVARMPPLSEKALPFYLLLSVSLSLLVLLYGEPLALLVLRAMRRLPYGHLNGGILIFLFILAWFFDGPLGVFVLASASLLGLFTLSINAPRRACMGVLMVPVLIG